mmetsp:Transcript_15932/g.20226  ORF Transcript_15932/g.20226 Transcript_15932/m.20226 type:complete len:427 (-) Transcript_15932:230-1510(-)
MMIDNKSINIKEGEELKPTTTTYQQSSIMSEKNVSRELMNASSSSTNESTCTTTTTTSSITECSTSSSKITAPIEIPHSSGPSLSQVSAGVDVDADVNVDDNVDAIQVFSFRPKTLLNLQQDYSSSTSCTSNDHNLEKKDGAATPNRASRILDLETRCVTTSSLASTASISPCQNDDVNVNAHEHEHVNQHKHDGAITCTKQLEKNILSTGTKRASPAERDVRQDSLKKKRTTPATTIQQVLPQQQQNNHQHFSFPACTTPTPISDIGNGNDNVNVNHNDNEVDVYSTSNDKVVAQLAEELMDYEEYVHISHVSPTPSVVTAAVEATPIPLLTPPASPVSFRNTLEWPSNLAVDNALTAAAVASKLHPPSLSSLVELEEGYDYDYDCGGDDGDGNGNGGGNGCEPFVQIVFPRNWYNNSLRLKSID